MNLLSGMKITDKITITNEDNMEMMSRYPDNYFELAIVDPPYGIGEDGKKNHSRGGNAKPTLYHDKNWDSKAVQSNVILEIQRVSKNQIIWGANHFAGQFNSRPSGS